ncbi:hypothetical protein D3C75_731790 [compost metagenome]
MGIGDTGLEAELAAAEEAAGLVVQVGHALRRLRVVGQCLAIGAAGGARCARSHRLCALDPFGRGPDQAFGRRCCRGFLDLAYALLQYHQRLLLCLVALLEFEQFLLQCLDLRVGSCEKGGGRSQGGQTDNGAEHE